MYIVQYKVHVRTLPSLCEVKLWAAPSPLKCSLPWQRDREDPLTQSMEFLFEAPSLETSWPGTYTPFARSRSAIVCEGSLRPRCNEPIKHINIARACLYVRGDFRRDHNDHDACPSPEYAIGWSPTSLHYGRIRWAVLLVIGRTQCLSHAVVTTVYKYLCVIIKADWILNSLGIIHLLVSEVYLE